MYVVADLLDALLSLADGQDPQSFVADLGTTRAGDLGADTDLDPLVHVFTHFYLPEAGRSVSDVFGFDLGTGPGQTDGRFISHPDGELAVRSTDDLHERMLVAVPPYDRESVRAFDRSGDHQPMEILDVVLPDEAFDAL